MNKYQLTEYAELLFSAAVYKTENITDAEDLVQDTLIAALAAIEQKKEISDPKGWLMTVLNRRYYDMLRRKYRKPLVSFDVIEDIPENNTIDRFEFIYYNFQKNYNVNGKIAFEGYAALKGYPTNVYDEDNFQVAIIGEDKIMIGYSKRGNVNLIKTFKPNE